MATQNIFPVIDAFKITRSDWYDFYRSRPNNVWWFIVPIFCLGMISALIEDDILALLIPHLGSNFAKQLMWVITIALGLLIAFAIQYLKPFVQSHLSKKSQTPINAKGELDGFVYEAETQQKYRWEDLRIDETDNLIILSPDKKTNLIVPKRAFSGLSAIRKFAYLGHELGNDEFLSAAQSEKESLLAKHFKPPIFDIEYNLNPEDYARFGQKFATFNWKWGAFSVFCAFVFGYASSIKNWEFSVLAFFMGLGASAIAIIALSIGMFLRENYFQNLFAKGKIAPLNIIARDENINIYLGNYCFGQYEYQDFAIEVFDDYLFIVDFKNQKFLVPSRAFDKIAEFEKFRDFLIEKTSSQ